MAKNELSVQDIRTLIEYNLRRQEIAVRVDYGDLNSLDEAMILLLAELRKAMLKG